MANVTIDILPTSYTVSGGSSTPGTSVETTKNVSYFFVLPSFTHNVTPLKFKFSYKLLASAGKNGHLYIYKNTTAANNKFSDIPFTLPYLSDYADQEFDLSDIDFPNEYRFYFNINFTNSGNTRTKDPVLSVSVPELEVSASPASLYTGGEVSLAFANRFSQNLNVKFYYNSTLLASKTASGNSLDVTCPESWFTTAGVSGNSMTVKVRASDDLNRSAEATFTLQKTTAGSVTLVAPKNTTVNGSETINFSWSYSGAGTLTKTELQWSTDNVDFTNLAMVSSGGTTYSAQAYTFPKGTVYWRARVTNSQGLTSDWSSGVSFTVSFPTLSVEASPSSLYAGNRVSLRFTNRLDQSLAVKLYYSSTLLDSKTATGDALDVTCPESWFTTAGVSGNSMSVKVRASDELGRTSSDVTFTLQRLTAGSITLVAPRSTTVNGNEEINFSWNYSGDGTLTKTELQWSTDNAAWTSLKTIEGSGTVWTAPAYSFPKGTVYWRARVTNSYGLTSGWSSGVSFTVSFPTLSVGVTPSNLYAGSAVTLNFTNRLSRALTVSFYYNTTLLASETATGDTLDVTCPETWFSTAGVSGNSMSVKARASDDLGRTSSDSSFTLQRPTGGTISPIAPRSTTADGAGAINFAWSYSGDGDLTKTELQWSTDNADWRALATINGSGTNWTASAVNFPKGTVYWRGRATNSLGKIGSWSSGVSFTVNYTAVSQVVPASAPTGGIVNAALDQTFTVALEASGPVYSPFTIAAATLYWRAGTSGDYTAVVMTPAGQSASTVIAGGTFAAGTVQWYATATDNTGRTTETEHYTVSTLAAEVQAFPLSPIDTLETGTSAIVFRWTYGSVDGSPQGKAEIQFSTDGIDWDEPITISGDATTYPAPAGSFGSGTVYWRVKSYNRNNLPSPWSDTVSFKCFGSAIVTAVNASAVPFSTVSWQTSGQLAYEIKVAERPDSGYPGIESAAGKLYGPYFGANVRSFTLPDPLPNGLNTVSVRVQNSYGLWSEWVSAMAAVQNEYQPGTVIIGYNIVNSVLNISLFNNPSEAGVFRLYRDGKCYIKTDEPNFDDRAANGGAKYVAIKILPTGHFKTSIMISPGEYLGELYPVEHPMLGPLEEGDFIELRLSENASRAPTIQRTREVAYTQYAGAKYPEAEIGEHETLTATGDAAWTHEQRDEAAAFEDLLGKAVIYKTPSGEVVVGVLEGFSRRDPLFFKSYSFTITQMDWEDFVDE